jgi:rRNA-processing protein FCF1
MGKQQHRDMAAMTQLLILDTNTLIQYRGFDEIPWSETFGSTDFELVIPFSVLGEIDRHKWSTNNNRVRDSAQRVAKLIRKARKLEADYGGPRLSITNKVTSAALAEHGFSRDAVDDCILAEVLAMLAIANGKDVVLVTEDISMTVRAEAAGVKVGTPPEAYRLSNDDPREKELRKLREENQKFQSARPKVEPFIVVGDDDCMTIKIVAPNEPMPTDAIIDALLKAEGRYMALKEIDSFRTEADWTKYFQSWDRYLSNLRKYILSAWRYKNRLFALQFGIHNSGDVSADGIELYLHFPDGFELGERPKPPATMWDSLADFSERLQYPLIDSMASLYRPNVAPPSQISIKKTNSYEVRLDKRSLSQSLRSYWAPLTLSYADDVSPSSFVVDYKLVVANGFGTKKGKFNIVFESDG